MSGRGCLALHLYGTPVARLEDTPRHPTLTWTEDAQARWGQNSPILSAKLRITKVAPPPVLAAAVLGGLLPEGTARTRMAERAGVDPDDLWGMLARYGRDTPGALDVRSDDDDVETPSLVPVTEDEVAALLMNDVSESTLLGGGHSRTSLPGMMPKVALARTPNGWALPAGGAPSTHIVKLGHPAGSIAADVIDTEVAAFDLAGRCGLGSVSAHLHHFAAVRAIVVTRFDRVATGDGVTRVHQEDAAQALGLSTVDPARKFQHGKALPSWAAIARAHSDAGGDLQPLVRLMAFRHALGDTDTHAKNIGFLHHDDGEVAVAPVYDCAMHLHSAHHPERSALDVNGKGRMVEITVADLTAEAMRWGVPRRLAHRLVRDTLDRLGAALVEIDRGAYPGVSDSAWTTVTERAQRTQRDAV